MSIWIVARDLSSGEVLSRARKLDILMHRSFMLLLLWKAYHQNGRSIDTAILSERFARSNFFLFPDIDKRRAHDEHKTPRTAVSTSIDWVYRLGASERFGLRTEFEQLMRRQRLYESKTSIDIDSVCDSVVDDSLRWWTKSLM